MILRKKIIEKLGEVKDNGGLLERELSEGLCVSVASLRESAAGLVDLGLVRAEMLQAHEGKRSLCKYFLGNGATMAVVIREDGGLRLSVRDFGGKELQGKFVARNHSLTLEEDSAAVAGTFSYLINKLSNDGLPFIFGALVSDPEADVWRRAGAELVMGSDAYHAMLERSKLSSRADILVRLKERNIPMGLRERDNCEFSVMRRGEEILSRREWSVENTVGLAELARLFECESFTLDHDEGLEAKAAELISEIRAGCEDLGFSPILTLGGSKWREELLFAMLRNRLCDKGFKLKRDKKKRRD